MDKLYSCAVCGAYCLQKTTKSLCPDCFAYFSKHKAFVDDPSHAIIYKKNGGEFSFLIIGSRDPIKRGNSLEPVIPYDAILFTKYTTFAVKKGDGVSRVDDIWYVNGEAIIPED